MSRDFGRSDVSHLVCAYMSRDKSLSQLVAVRVLRPNFHVAGYPNGMGYKVRQTATVYRIDTLLLVCTTSATVYET